MLRQYIADAFGASCSFGQVRHTNIDLIKRFGLEHEHLPKVVAITNGADPSEQDELFFVEHTGTISLESVGGFLSKLRQNADEGAHVGPVYLDGRKRNIRWGDEHRDKTVEQSVRDKVILARYCKQNIAASISAEMEAVVRQLHGLRAGWFTHAYMTLIGTLIYRLPSLLNLLSFEVGYQYHAALMHLSSDCAFCTHGQSVFSSLR